MAKPTSDGGIRMCKALQHVRQRIKDRVSGYRKPDPLRELLIQQVQRIRDETVQSPGQLSENQLESLERLSRLAQLSRSVSRSSARRSLSFVVVGGIVLIVILLFSFRVSTTEVEIELVLSEVDFMLSSPQSLFGIVQVSALDVSWLRAIQLPPVGDPITPIFPFSDLQTPIVSLSLGDTLSKGTINLKTPRPLPAQTRVVLRTTEIPYQYELILIGTGLNLNAVVSDSVQINVPGLFSKPVNFGDPKSILLQGGANGVELNFTTGSNLRSDFSPQLAVQDLSLFQIEQFEGPATPTLVRHISTVLSGTLYVTLTGREYKLRSREAILFADSRGEIRTLKVQDDHILLRFHGRVKGMSTGAGEERRSLMPTCFEWLQVRCGSILLALTAILSTIWTALWALDDPFLRMEKPR